MKCFAKIAKSEEKMSVDILEKLKTLKPALKEQFGIEKLAIFGSQAEGRATDESDVDIAIIKMDRKNGFLVARAKSFLSDQLQKEVDIGHLDSIRPIIRKHIEKSLIYV